MAGHFYLYIFIYITKKNIVLYRGLFKDRNKNKNILFQVYCTKTDCNVFL